MLLPSSVAHRVFFAGQSRSVVADGGVVVAVVVLVVAVVVLVVVVGEVVVVVVVVDFEVVVDGTKIKWINFMV